MLFRQLLLLLTLLAFPCSALAEEASQSQQETPPNQLTDEQIEAGWISLFDGQTLFGWEPTSDADWRVDDGVLRVSKGKPGWLMTTSEFADFVLEIEFRCPPETNSGVFIRSAKQPTDPAKDCVELNIAPKSHEFPTGNFVGREKRGNEETVVRPHAKGEPEPLVDYGDGKWHKIYIKAWSDGNWTKEAGYVPSKFGVYSAIDKKTFRAAIDDRVSSGRIGLQFTGGEIEFRNIRLKPRGMKPIFDGKSLAGWNTKLAKASEFKVTGSADGKPGELQVLNGRGQLESERSYGDFILQLDCRVDGDGLNSGVFFRCIPGEFTNGYECQIHNGMKDGDPTKPLDCGTGGFYRRQDARRIVAKDHEWFTMTLTANGAHMAAWVDGYQVSDWTDTRDPNENPRKGLRLKPGTLAIQGHDPTTNFRFRKIRIVELPEQKARMTNDE